MLKKLPQTLLFGNGLNFSIGKTWDELLALLKQNNVISDNTLPNTMTYEQILLRRLFQYKQFDNINEKNNLNHEEFSIKTEVSKYMQNLKIPDIYNEIINLNFDNYLTTNYDNIFIEAYQKMYKNKANIRDTSTETLYSIRRYKELTNGKFWHIHGEINHPKTIMLGMDHYIGSVSKIDDYIKGSYKFSNRKVEYNMEDKIKLNHFDDISWIELFFKSDVHILGFGLDYSEIDLWSILNKRSRLMHKVNVNNKIFFYEKKLSCRNCNNVPENVKKYEEKMELLKSFNVIVVELDCDYDVLYQNAIQKIKNNQDILN